MKKSSNRYILCLGMIMASFLQTQGAQRAESVSSSSIELPSLESVHSSDSEPASLESAHYSDTPDSEVPSPEDIQRNTELRRWWALITKYEKLAYETSDPLLKAQYQRMAQTIRDLFVSSGASGLTPDEVDVQ